MFVGKDVAAALGYKNVNKALADHVDVDDLTKRYPIIDNLGRKQQAILINESGLYSLILSSKLTQAKASRLAQVGGQECRRYGSNHSVFDQLPPTALPFRTARHSM